MRWFPSGREVGDFGPALSTERHPQILRCAQDDSALGSGVRRRPEAKSVLICATELHFLHI